MVATPVHVHSADAQENCAPVRAASASSVAKPLANHVRNGVTTVTTTKQQQQTTTTTTSAPRRALQSIDANRMAPSTTAHAPALATAKHALGDDSSSAKAPLSGLKRKHDALQSAQPQTPAQQQRSEPLTPVLERDYESENLAWLDMLVALLERKYRSHSLPVSIDALEAAKPFVPRASRSHTKSSSSSSSRRVSGVLSVARDSSSPSASGADDAAEREKEERRLRVLLRHAQQIQDSSVASSACCGCKTGCLKMYCVCFSTRGYCHASCACEDCKNSRQHKAQRVEAIQSYLANDPRAFSFASHPSSASTAGFLHLLPQKSTSVVLRGCRCKKSKCLKKYCECYQNGIACTAHCRCVDCSNDAAAAHHAAHKRSGATAARAFHDIQLTVTKKPKRNGVQKSIRLAL